MGDGARGGVTRGAKRASDHARGCEEKYRPCGSVAEESAELHRTFGSSEKTRAFIVETIDATWNARDAQEQAETSRIQIKRENGPESSGSRTQFLYRLGELSDIINGPVQLLYSPPSHSNYHPIERCWGLLELKWNGTKLIDAETMLGWAKKMTWKGLSPVVHLSRKVYEKGMARSQAAMAAVEARWKRDPTWPQYDIGINPTSSA